MDGLGLAVSVFLFFFLVAGFFLFEVHVCEQVVVMVLTGTAGLGHEVVDGNLNDLSRRDGLSVVKGHLEVEKRLVATLGLAVTLSIIKVHDHDLIEFLDTVVIEFIEAVDHLSDGVSVNIGQ